MAMIAARKGSFHYFFTIARLICFWLLGCIAMIYPGAFNTTTGPLHWELLQRAR